MTFKPEDLADALQDPIHPASGRLIKSEKVGVRRKGGYMSTEEVFEQLTKSADKAYAQGFAAGRRAGIEDAAAECESPKLKADVTVCQQCWNEARRECASAIRALLDAPGKGEREGNP